MTPRMSDWLTPEEQAAVTDENFWGWYQIAVQRENDRQMLKSACIGLPAGVAIIVLIWLIDWLLTGRVPF